MQLILASKSPRRREILSFFNLSFKQISPKFDENSIPFQGDPAKYVQMLAQGKVNSLTQEFPHELILGADTIVYKDGKIYGKPKDLKQAFDYLKELSGKWHSVFTSLIASLKGQNFQVLEETRVLFNQLTEKNIQRYHQMIDFSDKAGGYAIQGEGSLIVKRIEGCYYNVMGLPINALHFLLEQIGIDLWEHLKGKYEPA